MIVDPMWAVTLVPLIIISYISCRGAIVGEAGEGEAIIDAYIGKLKVRPYFCAPLSHACRSKTVP